MITITWESGRGDPAEVESHQWGRVPVFERLEKFEKRRGWVLSLHIFYKSAEVVLHRRLGTRYATKFAYLVQHEKEERAREVFEYFTQRYEPARRAELQALEASVEKASAPE